MLLPMYEVKLSLHNKTKNFLVSTLVGKHFLNNKSPDKKIMHIGDVTKNDIENFTNAVVSKDLPSNGVYVGNPAKRIMSFEEFAAKQKEIFELGDFGYTDSILKKGKN